MINQIEGYMTMKETAEKWGLSLTTVQKLKQAGRIIGVVKVGYIWLVPADHEKPTGKRNKSAAPQTSQVVGDSGQVDAYMTIKEAAERWRLTPTRVHHLREAGRIDGVVRVGNIWLIPKDHEKPEDARVKSGKYIGFRENLGKTNNKKNKG